TRHRRTLNSWYWLGWWVQPVLESARDLLLAHEGPDLIEIRAFVMSGPGHARGAGERRRRPGPSARRRPVAVRPALPP
ncbi:hypothetical protein ACWD6Z_28105, partial [Streptomyces californicus]